jgi:hypothetical protein
LVAYNTENNISECGDGNTHTTENCENEKKVPEEKKQRIKEDECMKCTETDRVKGNPFPVHAMKAYRQLHVWIHSFLTSALFGGEWLTTRASASTSGKKPGTN